MTAPHHVVIGCFTVDNVIGAGRDRRAGIPGGNVLWAAVGAHMWDPRVGLVGRAGNNFPSAALEALSGAGFDLAGVTRIQSPGLRVAFAYQTDGSRTRQVPEATLGAIPESERGLFVDNTSDRDLHHRFAPSPSDLPPDWRPFARGWHIPALPAIETRELVQALSGDRQHGQWLTADGPSDYALRDQAWTEADYLAGLDVVLPSEDDLGIAPGSLAGVAGWFGVLSGAGSRAVVLKRGAFGSIVFGGAGRVWRVPAFPSPASDPTGAGDSFCGGFLVGLAETSDPVRAAVYGTAAASFAVDAPSALDCLQITREDVELRAREVSIGVEEILLPEALDRG